eukprot:Sspe_Gene.118672::Locus_112674_Transcript_1_1_Confidence_1.000_Length_387::g.118672::m.118672
MISCSQGLSLFPLYIFLPVAGSRSPNAHLPCRTRNGFAALPQAMPFGGAMPFDYFVRHVCRVAVFRVGLLSPAVPLCQPSVQSSMPLFFFCQRTPPSPAPPCVGKK